MPNADDYTTLSLSASTMDTPAPAGHVVGGAESAPLFIIGILGILGNGLVLVVLLTHKSSRARIVNILVINQSIVDFLTSWCFIVTYISKSVSKSYAGKGAWWCYVMDNDVGIWMLLTVSTSSLMIITMERYLMVIHPIFYRNKVTRNRILAVIIITAWLFSSCLMGSFNYPLAIVKDGACIPQGYWPSVTLAKFFSSLIFVLYFLSPVCLFLLCYGHMLWVIMRRYKVQPTVTETAHNGDAPKHSKMSKTQLNLTKVMIIVSVCFTVCWGPIYVHYIMMFLAYMPGLSLSSTVYRWLTYLAFCNSCINPFVYAFKYDDFKRNFRRMVLRGKTEQATSSSHSAVSTLQAGN